MSDTKQQSSKATDVVSQGTETQNGVSKKKRPDQSYWSLVKHQFKKRKMSVLAFYFIVGLFVLALLADFLANDKPIFCQYKGEFYAPVFREYLVDLGIAKYPPELVNVDWKKLNYDWSIFPPIPYSSTSQDPANSFAEPFVNKHYLGTDQPGRDLLAGLIHGSRVSLSIGVISMSIAAFIGIILGALAGYFRGWVDIVISRLIEIFLNFPVFFLIIIIVAFLGAKILYVMIVIGVTGWMGIARLVRGEVLKTRNLEFVTAANSLGFSSARIIFRHVLPNSLSPVFVTIAFGVASAILTESALSFLGFGVPAEVVTWGSMLNHSRDNMSAWWSAIFPGLMIFLTVFSYNMIGDGLRDAMDPRLRD